MTPAWIDVAGDLARNHLWQGVVIAAAAWGVARLGGRFSAERRSWVWLSALIASAVAPAALFLPGSGVPVTLPAVEVFEAAGRSTPAARSDIPLFTSAASTAPATVTEPAATDALDASPPPAHASWRAAMWTLAAVWAAGTLLLLGRMARSWARLGRIRDRAAGLPSEDPRIPERWPLNVRILISDDTEALMVCGLATPVVVAPKAAMNSLPERVIRELLQHELAHVRRGDHRWIVLERLIAAALWWSPVVWWLQRRLHADREQACDAAASRAVGDPKTFARSLLAFAKSAAGREHAPLAVGVIDDAHRGLELRVRHLSRKENIMRSSSSLANAACALALAVAVGSVAAATPRSAAEAAHPHPEERREARLGALGYALVEAAARGNRNDIEVLIDAGADLDATVDGDGSALIMAAKRGRSDIADMLLEAGADPDVYSPGDGTALIMAARHGHGDLVDVLLEHGADVNAPGPGDGNPLIAAAGSGELAIARTLVDAGADVNGYVKGDETPLINAAQRGDLRVVRFLVDEGADVGLGFDVEAWRNGGLVTEWRSPLSMAERFGHDDVADYLRAQGADR